MTDYITALESGTGPYYREAAALFANLHTENTRFDPATGVIRWASNDRVPPADVVEFFAYLDEAIDVDACAAARDADTAAFLAEYRAIYTGPSDEERAEARAAMGPGVEMVNVVTGHRWTT